MVVGAFFNVNTTMIFCQSNCHYMVAIDLENFRRKISEKISKLVLTIIGEGDIVYIVAGDTNKTKQHRSKDSLQKSTAR